MPGSHSKKDKLKKRIAALDDVTSQHKKKRKDKEKLIHGAKGFSNIDKINNRITDREKRLAEKAIIEQTPEDKQDVRAHITRDQNLMDNVPKEKWKEYTDPQSLAKGVAPNYGNPSKVKKKRLKGKVSKLKSRLAGLTHKKKSTQFPVGKDPAGKPLWNVDKSGIPKTKADRMKRYEYLKHQQGQGGMGTVYQDVKGNQVTKEEYDKGGPNITDTDFGRKKGKSFGAKKAEDHEHSIQFKGYRGQYYKRANLVSTQGKFAKYWLLNAKQTNGNGWGVSQQSIAKNIHKFVGRPLVVTAKSWVPESVYGDVYEHPYLPTNDIGQVLNHQEKYRVGNIVDIIEKNGDYYANIEINQKFAHMILPPFCSPAIFQNNPAEAEGQISDWEALHLAALHEDPAYGSRIALLRGTCVGTQDQCTIQFKSAKQEAKVICTKDLKGRLATLKKNKNKSRLAREDWDKDEGINDPDPFHRKGGIDISDTEFMDRARENSRRSDLHYKLKVNDEVRQQNNDLYRELWDKINADSSIKDKEAEFRLRKPPSERVQPYKEFSNRTGYSSALGEELEERRGGIRSYNMKSFGRKKGFLGNSGITDLATIDQSYIEKNKLSKLRQRLAAVPPTTKINQKDGETIANAYDKMLHDPNNPAVKESYNALINETNAQFNELKKNGLRIDAIEDDSNPYQTADDLHNDLKKNNHIYYYPSEKGFGSSDNKFGDHPLLTESTSTYKGKKLLNNDVFRIVHDVNGHNIANSDFSPEGEHNAFLQHRKMYSPLANKALFTETAAQANWGSWNKKSGASNRELMKEGRVNELVFADQKAGILSDDIVNTEWHTGETRTGKLRQRIGGYKPVFSGDFDIDARLKKIKQNRRLTKKEYDKKHPIWALQTKQENLQNKITKLGTDMKHIEDINRGDTSAYTQKNAERLVTLDNSNPQQLLTKYNTKLKKLKTDENQMIQDMVNGKIPTTEDAVEYIEAYKTRTGKLRQRLAAIGDISNLNDKMISKARYKGKDFPHKTNPSAFLTPDGTFVGTNDHAQTVLETDPSYNKFVTEKGGSFSRATTQWLRDSGAYRLRGIYPDYNKRESLSGLHIEGYTEPTKQQIKQLTKLRDQVGSENVDWAGVDITEKLGLGIKKPQERTHTQNLAGKLRQRIAAIKDFGEDNINEHFTAPINKKNDLGRKLRKKRIDKTQPHIGGGEPYKRKGRVVSRSPPSKDFFHTLPFERTKPGTMEEDPYESQMRDKFPRPKVREKDRKPGTLFDNEGGLQDREFAADSLDDPSILDPEKWSGEDLKELEDMTATPSLTNYTSEQPLRDSFIQESPGSVGISDPWHDVMDKKISEEGKYIRDPNYKIKPINPTRMEWRAIISAKLKQRIAGIQRTAKPIIQETGEGITFKKVDPKIYGKKTYGWHKVPMHPSNSILIRPRDPKNYMDLVNHFRKIHETPDFAKFTQGSVQQAIPINSLRNNIKHMTGEPLKRHADISTAANKAFKKGDILMRRVGGKPAKGKYGTVGETFYIEEDSPAGETFNEPSKSNRAKLNQRLGRLILGKQRTAVMSKNVSNIINSFKESGVSYKGIDGIWDAVEKRVLNANDEPDRERLWDTFGRRGMGFNSVTDTRGGPNDDLKLIADQLTKIEESGGNPALGFDSSYGGSLEAVDVTYGTVPEALSKLSPQQESIGYLDEDGKFTIEYNDRYLGKK